MTTNRCAFTQTAELFSIILYVSWKTQRISDPHEGDIRQSSRRIIQAPEVTKSSGVFSSPHITLRKNSREFVTILQNRLDKKTHIRYFDLWYVLRSIEALLPLNLIHKARM